MEQEQDMKQRWMQHKPHNAKLLDYYYDHCQGQSSEIKHRKDFLNDMQQLQAQFADECQVVPFSGNVKGLLLKPKIMEEWRASTSTDRLHERNLHEKLAVTTSSHDNTTIRTGVKASWTTKPLIP